MIGDVLSDAIDEIERYQRQFPGDDSGTIAVLECLKQILWPSNCTWTREYFSLRYHCPSFSIRVRKLA
jgi:hypothetical protein